MAFLKTRVHSIVILPMLIVNQHSDKATSGDVHGTICTSLSEDAVRHNVFSCTSYAYISIMFSASCKRESEEEESDSDDISEEQTLAGQKDYISAVKRRRKQRKSGQCKLVHLVAREQEDGSVINF